MMKKAMAVLTAALIVCALAGCGSGASGTFNMDSYQTIGDVMALDTENVQWGTSDSDFIYAIEMNGSYYRFKAEMTPEQEEALMSVDYAEDDYEEQQDKIIAAFVITDRQAVDDLKLSQEQCDAFVGKTGQELFDAGWTTGMGYNLAESEFWLYYGPFCYTVTFEGEFEESEDIYDDADYILDRTVKAVAFRAAGDMTNWE